ncbi:diadenylate cyclase CdaA [[Limnothrix rosea] IAM M-220]|uniref:diadenylate cyclase CdaA n=1 Tax=[Limnothrix rosea] IAM M-220 TaxID=454133 RepID=UPI00095C3F89|nr:diadenylate cyclase CdaA [[Limnothrix rosea] IAM M-220]OKH17595.1 TIGR00159 family protein [[Limnothrix rosea] IAM M-220]
MPSWLFYSVDIALTLFLIYVALFVIEERRTLWVVRGFLVLIIAEKVAHLAQFGYVEAILDKLVLISAVAIAIVFQSQLRRLLERIGRGDIVSLLRPSPVRVIATEDNLLDSIVEAIKSLSQNRTGALLVIETITPMDEKDFSVPGVILNAEISKELLQTIFQTSTLLHDGAVFISGSRIVAAGVILPLSEKSASRQLGTRHRAAMGITERVEHCVCVVVSEETGSISLAERGNLNRPLTSSKLKELLAEYFTPSDHESVTPDLGRISRQLSFQGRVLLERFLRLPSSTVDKD